MTLDHLLAAALDKKNFTEISDYVEFCKGFLDFLSRPGNIQAEIVARNEQQYRFLQFKNASASITSPLNYNLFYNYADAKPALD